MTVGQLRKILDELPRDFDDCNVVVWLPGSRIDLVEASGFRDPSRRDDYLLEGNIREGSMLS